MRSYETARSLFSIIEFVGWCCVILGGIVFIIGVASYSSLSEYGGTGAGMAALLPGLAIMFMGIIGVAIPQVGRAAVDTAEISGQILKVSRDQLEVSRSSLKQGKTLEQGFASLQVTPNDEASESHQADFAKHRPQGVQSALPQGTSPENLIEQDMSDEIYFGRRIHVKGDKVIYNGIKFDTKDKAKAYIDAFSDVPSQTKDT